MSFTAKIIKVERTIFFLRNNKYFPELGIIEVVKNKIKKTINIEGINSHSSPINTSSM